jgi:hypothetical protein
MSSHQDNRTGGGMLVQDDASDTTSNDARDGGGMLVSAQDNRTGGGMLVDEPASGGGQRKSDLGGGMVRDLGGGMVRDAPSGSVDMGGGMVRDTPAADAGDDGGGANGGNNKKEETKDDDNGGDDAETTRKALAVYNKGLVYYKRNDPLLNRRRRGRQTDPTHILLPNGKTCLGFPPSENVGSLTGSQGDDEAANDDDLVVFSSPGQDQLHRANVFTWLLSLFLFIDLIVIIIIFVDGSMVNDIVTSGVDDTPSQLQFACTFVSLILAGVAIRLRDSRLVTLFIAVFYVDALLNLLRVYTALQFTHFIAQLVICHLMTQYRTTLTATWFTPARD